MSPQKKRSLLGRLAALAVVAVGLAGCDKCGQAVKFNTPSLPNSCGDTRDAR